MSGDSAVSGLSLHDAVAVDADGGHETERTEALSDDIGLDISIVVLAGPNETTIALNNLSNDIVDETMFVPEALGLEGLKVLLLVDLLESIDEKTVVLLENGVLGRHLEGEITVERVLEASTGEGSDRFVSVEHTHVDTSIDIGDVLLDGRSTVLGGEGDIDTAGLGDDVVLATVLVTESVSSNDDGLGPAWHTAGDVGDNDGLSEDGTVEDVSDGSVGGSPHLLEVEFLNTALVGGDGGALDGDLMFLGGLSSVDGDLIVSGVTAGHRQVVVLSLEVNVGVDVTLLDPLPDDAGHLITVHVDDGVGNLNLAEGGAEVSLLDESGKHVFRFLIFLIMISMQKIFIKFIWTYQLIPQIKNKRNIFYRSFRVTMIYFKFWKWKRVLFE